MLLQEGPVCIVGRFFFQGRVLRSRSGEGVGVGRGVIQGFWGWKFWQAFFGGEGVA